MSVHCLLIEDDVFTRDVFALTLRRAKMEVAIAPNGEEALAYLETHQPDVLIIDLHLPNVSGYDLIKMIRNDERLQQIYIVVITANPAAIRSPEARLADAFLTKPINMNEMIEVIEKLVSVGHA